MTRELVSALYETVWAVNPENDNLDALASLSLPDEQPICSQAQLRCRLEVPELPPGIPLSSHVRHNLIMAVKEAIHNVIKHARATEVRLRIAFEASALSIAFKMTAAASTRRPARPGTAWANLKRRMQAIGGSFTIESRLGAGTTVSLRLPVAAAAAGPV